MSLRLSEAEYHALLKRQGTSPILPGKGPSKWPHIPCEEDGWKFDSRDERDEYRDLKLRVSAKQIIDLKVHPVYTFVVNDKKIGIYTADFSYTEKGQLIVVEVKNPANAKERSFRRNCKLMWAHHGIEVVVVVRSPRSRR